MFFIILLIIPVLFGLIILLGFVAELASITADDVSTISYKSMSEGKEYYLEEMVLVDSYAYYVDTTNGKTIESISIACSHCGERVSAHISTNKNADTH